MTKILIIEDEEILREEVMEWLELEGYEVATASDGMEGVRLAHEFRPDLILCDIGMPRLSGYDVILDIRSHPNTQLIPFIYITARSSYDDIRHGMSLGADDYIIKPFTRQELLQSVQTRTQKKALQEEYYHSEIEQWQQAVNHEHEQRLFKTKMIAMFSHDFRHQLASIMGANEILFRYHDRLDEERRVNHHKRIEMSVQQLTQMLEDLLVVAQLESGNLALQLEPLNLASFLEQIIEEFRLAHNATHSIVPDWFYNGEVLVDQRLIRQIVANLLSNAVKYSPVGSEITITLEYLDNQIILTVQDQGIGIPEADQTRLFNAFQRASNVGKVSGTGLGLAIVQQAVSSLGGAIHLESEVNVGTKIMVSLPT